MILEFLVYVKNLRSRRIIAREQLAADNQNIDFTIVELALQGVFVIVSVAVLLHHLVPELYDKIIGTFINIIVAFAHIRSRNHNFGPYVAKGVEYQLVAHCIALEVASKHRLEARFLIAIHKVLVNVDCHAAYARITRRKFLNAAPFRFQFSNLRLIQLFCDHLEPQIDIFFIDLLVHKAAFINQRDNRLVFNTIFDGVFVNQLSKTL